MIVVFTTILIDFIGFSVLFPVLPLYADRLGATPAQVGLIVTVYALAQLMFLPFWGRISDRIGRRPVILFSLFGTVVSFVVLAFADTMAWIYLARALAGFFAASIGTAQAVVTDVTSPSDRAHGMGMIGAAFGAGMVVGPMLGGITAGIDERAPFWSVAVLAAANWMLAWARLPESRPAGLRQPEWRDLAASLVPTPLRLVMAVHDRRIALYLYLFLHVFTAFAVLESMITFYAGRRFGADELDMGILFAWIGVFLALTQGVLLRRLVVEFGETRLVALGLSVMGAALASVAWAPSFEWLFPIGAALAFGNGVAFPTFTSLYSKACQAEEAGELLGQSQSMATTGRVLGPVGAGLAMQQWSDGAPFWIAAAMMLTALVIFVLKRRTLLHGMH